MSADSRRGNPSPARRTVARPQPLVWAGLAVALLGGQFAHGETLTLADCLRETAEHNPQIIEKRLELEQAGGQKMVFHARAYPTLLLGGLLGDEGRQTTETLQVRVAGANGKPTTITERSPRPSTFFLIGDETLYQPLFDAAIPASWRRGNVELSVARSNFLVTASAELFAARSEFYSVLFQQEEGALLQAISQSLAGNFNGVSQLEKAGLTNRQAVLAAQVEQINFAPQILSNTGLAQTGLTTLLQTMGRPLGAGTLTAGSVKLSGPWEDGPLVFDAAGMAKLARARRPDLLALRDTVRAFTEDANIAHGGYYPLVRIFVTGELLPENFVQNQRSGGVRPGDNTQQTQISPGVREDWNVIDTGNVRGNVRRLRSISDALAFSLHHLEEDIPSELDLVRAQWEAANREREIFKKNVALADDNLDAIRSGVTQGTQTQLDFLNAQTADTDTRVGLLATELRLSIAHAEYDRVIGGYLRFITEEKPVSTPAASFVPK